jgi:hypothetical protein
MNLFTRQKLALIDQNTMNGLRSMFCTNVLKQIGFRVKQLAGDESPILELTFPAPKRSSISAV